MGSWFVSTGGGKEENDRNTRTEWDFLSGFADPLKLKGVQGWEASCRGEYPELPGRGKASEAHFFYTSLHCGKEWVSSFTLDAKN